MRKLSNSELLFLRQLWRAKQLSTRELHEATVAKTTWSYSTTRKTLDRMVGKDLIRVERVHGLKTYIAVTSKLETMATLLNDFARNVLDLDGPLPTATFVQSKLIDPNEIEALEKLLVERSAQNEEESS